MEHTCFQEVAALLHELDLGQHTLFIRSDGSIEVLAQNEDSSPRPVNGVQLDEDETYRLFISLREQFLSRGGTYGYAGN